MKISYRLWGIVIAATMGFAVLIVAALFGLRAEMMTDREIKTRHIVEVGNGVVAWFAAQEQSGKLSRDEAQAQALSALTSLRYEKDDYLWVHRQADSMMLAHPNAKLLNTSVESMQDKAGAFFFKDMNQKVAKEGAGLVYYMWPKPGQTEAVSKLSYVKGFAPWGWVIGSGIYIDDVNAAFWSSAGKQGINLALIVLVVGGVSVTVARGITRPLTSVTAALERLTADDHSVHIDYTDNKDEIGQLARGLLVFRRHVEQAAEEAAARLQATEAQIERQRQMDKLIAQFDSTVGDVVSEVTAASGWLCSSSQSMSSVAEQTSVQSTIVASAATQAACNVATVAAATEELHASEAEIARQVVSSTTIARSAAEEAERTISIVHGLTDAAARIGEVVTLIQNIAGKTNLLALNATIEAARAGEAGKGFAVVALEVKTLANQTSLATADISAQVESVQNAAKEAAEAISHIGAVIEDINRNSAMVAAAVEEQTAATSEIARNVEEAAAGTDAVSRTITDVRDAAQNSGDTAKEVLGKATQLEQHATSMRVHVEKFLEKVRALDQAQAA